MIKPLKIPGYYDGEYSGSNVLEIVEKLNELVEAHEQLVKCEVESLDVLSQQGECKHTKKYSVGADDWKCADCGKEVDLPYHLHNDKTGEIDTHTCKVANPPQQEESRGECNKCKGEGCWICTGIGEDPATPDTKETPNPPKPQLKEESPKEDEQEWTHDFYELMQTYRHTLITDQVGTSKAYELVKDYIKANFVSKVKIKREIDKLQKSCYEVDGVIDGITALHHLREKL